MIIERELMSEIRPVIASPEAIVITGMRRVGKTTLLQQLFKEIESDNKIFLDLENPLNRKYFETDDYERIADEFKLLGYRLADRGYIFLDEIQFTKNIPSVIKYLIDHYKIKFLLTGSASFYIRNLFSESLSGRKYLFELYPLSFREFLLLKNIKITLPQVEEKISEAAYQTINRHYDEYILYGGFPGVVQKESANEKKMMMEDIFSSYFQLEVVQLGDFRKINVVRDLMLLLMQRTGSSLDVQELSGELGVARETLNNYLSFFENTYFLKLIRPFTSNRDSEIRSMPKFYLCDTGFVNHFARVSGGALFENTIFSALRNQGEVNYYRRKSGAEIDFILNREAAIEVKNMASSKHLTKLRKLSADLKISNYYVVSRRYSKLDEVTYGFML